ncbi:ZIP zinc transporter-domain-containing protein [Echria macrotheca]|uniref:ZIP zinc transporter-domain-containing protein n=1 Tax=Echria macrotheca TaxID=438768 RepID=A0AAJ0B8E0_9PEZI|nr:ZIP zinc transporter-domain-containing protein [Echria macrotheca]
MPRLLRISVLSGLLAAPLLGGVSATLTQPALHQRAPQATETAPSSALTTSTPTLTAVSDCHLHDTTLFCVAGTTEYVVHTTATTDIPPAFTGCHTHDAETFCLSPSGGDVEISLASEAGHDDHDDHNDGTDNLPKKNCHFHAGVEHCTTEGDEEGGAVSCDKVTRDYNIPLRVGLLFVILVTSSIGVFTPILIASFVSPHNVVFTILRQFGTGIIISTAFIHLYTHANLMFQNQCLGELAYESTASAILMAGIFLSFMVEYFGIRLVQWHSAKSASRSPETASASTKSPELSTEMVNITVLEAGVIFHSLLIGLTLVVAGDTFFITLFIVILFHQMFEGIALGTRIAQLGRARPSTGLGHGHTHGLGHHGHFHEPKQPSPSTLAEEFAAASDHQQHPPHHHGVPKKVETASGEDSDDMASGNAVLPHHPAPAAAAAAAVPPTTTSPVSLKKKLLLATAFAFVTPLGMAIGIGALQTFNGNDPSTVIAIGTLDALSAGILVWVGVVEMWAHDWMLGGEMTTAGPVRTVLGMLALVAGMALMSLLGKWA